MASRGTKGAAVVGGRLLMVGSLGFLVVGIVEHHDEIPKIELNTTTVGALVLAVAISVMVNAIGALAWSWLVAPFPGKNRVKTGHDDYAVTDQQVFRTARFRMAFRIWALSNIAKYIPGNVFQYAGRYVLAGRSGLGSEAVLVSMGLEVFFLCAAAGALILSGLFTSSLGSVEIAHIIGQASFGFYGIAAAVMLLAFVISASLFPRLRDYVVRNLSRVGLLPALGAFGSYAIAFLAMGAAAFVLLEAVWRVDGAIGWYELSCGYALAFLLGYIVPGAPGGIGIREVVMVALFQSAIGAGLVLGLAVVLRLASMAADVVTFAAAGLIREQRP